MKSKQDLLQFKNCYILRNHEIIREDLWVRNGKIINPEPVYFEEKLSADVIYDCKEKIIAPGFIDLQINGAFGVDFSHDVDTIEEGVKIVAQGILAHGVTSFCPTIITSPREVYHKVLHKIKRQPGDSNGAGVLGIHIEGPFINQEKNGAHPESLILCHSNGFKDVLATYGNMSNVCLLTLAPELPHSEAVIRKLVENKIAVSLGHSTANLSVGESAVRAGATFITHLFNAMLPFHHRDPGLVGLLASDEISKGRSIFYGIIADGIHTHPAALRIAHKTHPKGLVLVTDAISAMGLEPGKHHIGQQVVEIKNNRALVAGTNVLCGSIATMNHCVKHFVEASKCTQVEALEAASLHPAQVLGITDEKGTLDFDSDADFIILDNSLNVLQTFISGKCVWKDYHIPPNCLPETIFEKQSS